MSAAHPNPEKSNPNSGFYQFLNKTSNLAIVIDHKLGIRYKNPKAALRIKDNKLQTVISSDHKKEFGLLLNKMIVKNIETYQTRVLFTEGTWYECQLTNLMDDAEVRGIVCILKEDVNNNHLSDEQPGTEHFYRTITDNLPAIIAYWTADLRCLFANKAYLSFFDKTENEMYNTRIDNLFTKEQISKHEHFMEQALKGVMQKFERTLVREGKEDKIIFTEYLPDVEDGHVMGFYTLIYDITDFKLKELELEQIFNCAPDIIAIAGTNGFYKKVNPAMLELLGFSETELLSQPFTSFIHPDDLDHSLDAFKDVTEGKAIHYFENRLIKNDGTQIWVAWNVTSATENGLIFCVGKDISERKYAEQEMISLNRRLEQQNKQLRDISWIQSHEVRAPTARILGIIDIIDSDEAHLSDELKEMMSFLKSSTLELDEVITKITALSSAKQKS